MILKLSQSYIKVQLQEKVATVKGEMFFSPNDKMGFAASKSSLMFWDTPNEQESISELDKKLILDVIQTDFDKGGRTLEIEQ